MTDPTAPSPVRGSGPPGDGRSVGPLAVILVLVSAAVVFWAGLNLGSLGVGRDPDERAAVEAFTETYRRITDQYIGTPAPEALVEGALEGMFEVLDDPHSGYMSADEYGSALDDALGEFEGIGAVMATEDDEGVRCEPIGSDCQLRITLVLAGAPAEEAGLLAGDIVTGVDGEPLDGATIDDSVRLIRGPKGSEVTLTLTRDGESQDLVVTRDTITDQEVHSAALAEGRIGYIGLDGFSGNSAADFEAALTDHLEAGIEALVVDVRDDPGGFVDAAVEITDHFLDGGPVFWEEDAAGEQTSIDASAEGLALDPQLEVVVLIDGGSASASEILAGALRDADRAQLVGETTFGKGTVQEWSELPGDNGGIRLSVAKWLTRDKTWVEGTGLTPDVHVEGGDERFWAGLAEADPEADEQLQAAVSVLLGDPLEPDPVATAAVPAATPILDSDG